MAKRKIHVHFVGINGAGADACAHLSKLYGFKVSGCDLDKNVRKFKKDGINVFIGHDPKHVSNVDLVAISPAVEKFSPDNAELEAAKKAGIPIFTWQEFTGKYLQKGKLVIAIAGTHGKSTTTAMIGHVLEDNGFDPVVLVGATDKKWGANFRFGQGKYFVVEADEYNDNFSSYESDIIAITNIDFDHPDFFADQKAYFESFKQFIFKSKGQKLLIAPANEIGINKLIDELKNWQGEGVFFEKLYNFKLKISGSHNIINATLAAKIGESLQISMKKIIVSLENFDGLKRRMDKLGEIGQVTYFSDFAHHPKELEVTINAARENFKGQTVWFVFQPHTYSRTNYFFDQFVKVLNESNISHIIVCDVFGSREQIDKNIDVAQMVKKINNVDAVYIPKLETVSKFLKKNTKKGDIVFLVGAGDVEKVYLNLKNIS
ncbi:MAG TPA: Mur ligase family protein [Patescibacteria group bacterium]